MTPKTHANLFDLTASRRTFLRQTAATAAVLLAARQLLPSGAYAAPAAPEVTAAKLGFIALTDAAPLIIAKEKGLFEKYGMPGVEVLKQASWGATILCSAAKPTALTARIFSRRCPISSIPAR
jgi:nitrate/nitrite transport system substrate-binding protein